MVIIKRWNLWKKWMDGWMTENFFSDDNDVIKVMDTDRWKQSVNFHPMYTFYSHYDPDDQSARGRRKQLDDIRFIRVSLHAFNAFGRNKRATGSVAIFRTSVQTQSPQRGKSRKRENFSRSIRKQFVESIDGHQISSFC